MDLVVMAIFAGSVLLGLATSAPAEPVTQRELLIGGAACLIGTAALFWRRRAPVAVAAVIVVLLVASLGLTGSTNSLELALGFAVYAIAASRPPWVAWTAFATVVAITSLAAWMWAAEVTAVTQDGQELDIDERATIVVGITLMSLAALAIGTSVRNRRLHVADLVERANAMARDRDQHAQIARAAERSRIAREMHDVVAHSLSVMIALADGAAAALERSPDRARLALTELSDTGRTALTDMRRVLGVLDSDAPLEPPGSQDLGDLVERFRTAGLPVRVEGLTTELPPDTGLALAVYRIVQEALTNSLRYARGTSSVDVKLGRDAGAVRVEVVDHGTRLPVADSGGAGRGLIGMAERAAVFGGTVDAGPWNDGWRVRAELPWRAET
jgi:signal transduction histidine kinase